MAKRTPFTAQQERLARLIANLQSEVTAIKGMVDTERGVVTAQILKIDDPASPQIIRVSEEGDLEAGGEVLPWRRSITVEASHTGDALETEVGKITMPANKMGPNGLVRITSIWETAIASKVNIYFGQINAANKVGYWTFFIASLLEARPAHVWNTNATNAQSASAATDPLALSIHYDAGVTVVGMTEDTTQDVDVYFTVQNVGAGDIASLHFALVEAFYSN